MGDPTSRSRERVARNFIKTYGRSRFRRLLEAMSTAESGQAVAEEFGVSRERVRQWKNTFGTLITLYQLHPEVERILNERKPPAPPAPPAQPPAPPPAPPVPPPPTSEDST